MVTHRPSQTTLRHSKPTGYHMACHGVARQGEDGRTLLIRQVRQVRQVRHKRHAAAPRTPPLLYCLHTPQAHFRPSQNTLRYCKPTGYTMAPPCLSQKFPKIPKNSQRFPKIPMQAPRRRNTHTPAAIKPRKNADREPYFISFV